MNPNGYLTILTIREMQVKTIMWYHYKAVGMAKVKSGTTVRLGRIQGNWTVKCNGAAILEYNMAVLLFF